MVSYLVPPIGLNDSISLNILCPTHPQYPVKLPNKAGYNCGALTESEVSEGALLHFGFEIADCGFCPQNLLQSRQISNPKSEIHKVERLFLLGYFGGQSSVSEPLKIET